MLHLLLCVVFCAHTCLRVRLWIRSQHFCSLALFSATNTLKDPRANTTPRPSLLWISLSFVIKVSAWPLWPEATLSEGREGKVVTFLFSMAGQHHYPPCVSELQLTLSCLRSLSLFNAILPFLYLSHSLFIFTHRPFTAWNKGRKCPDTSYYDYLYRCVIFSS